MPLAGPAIGGMDGLGPEGREAGNGLPPISGRATGGLGPDARDSCPGGIGVGGDAVAMGGGWPGELGLRTA